jgi:hypothetical protein
MASATTAEAIRAPTAYQRMLLDQRSLSFVMLWPSLIFHPSKNE